MNRFDFLVMILMFTVALFAIPAGRTIDRALDNMVLAMRAPR